MRSAALFAALALSLATFALRASAAKPHAVSQPSVGYCTSFKNLAAAKSAGFDYVELNTTEIATMPEDAFAAAAREIGAIGLPTPASNSFVPGTIKLTGPEIDRAAQTAYVTTAFDRVSRLGVRLVVFGSGAARRVPEGFPREEAVRQLVDFGKRIGPLARQRDITVAIEPLRREETNIINSAAEGLSLVEAVADPGFQLMIDFYHLASEHEDPGIIVRARPHLRHLHMANPQGRVFPRTLDEYAYEPFFAALRQIGYDQRISVEASTSDLQADAPRAIALLRRAL
jgi:sugar phosphate isomerase/epimerase